MQCGASMCQGNKAFDVRWDEEGRHMGGTGDGSRDRIMPQAGQPFMLVGSQDHQIGGRAGQMMDDRRTRIVRKRANLFDLQSQIDHLLLRAPGGKYTPPLKGRAYAREIFEALRGDGRVHMHDGEFCLCEQRQFERMGERHVTI